MTDPITNNEDIIDSRDIEERILELSDMVEDGTIDEVDKEELSALLAFKGEAEGYAPDWIYGAVLIRDSYFTEYAQDLAYDLGFVEHAGNWPYSCIDWDQAARELQIDYTSVEFDGETYWVR